MAVFRFLRTIVPFVCILERYWEILENYFIFSSEGGRSDKENKHIESSLSLSRSISHSSDREESEAHIKDTLQVFSCTTFVWKSLLCMECWSFIARGKEFTYLLLSYGWGNIRRTRSREESEVAGFFGIFTYTDDGLF